MWTIPVNAPIPHATQLASGKKLVCSPPGPLVGLARLAFCGQTSSRSKRTMQPSPACFLPLPFTKLLSTITMHLLHLPPHHLSRCSFGIKMRPPTPMRPPAFLRHSLLRTPHLLVAWILRNSFQLRHPPTFHGSNFTSLVDLKANLWELFHSESAGQYIHSRDKGVKPG